MIGFFSRTGARLPAKDLRTTARRSKQGAPRRLSGIQVWGREFAFGAAVFVLVTIALRLISDPEHSIGAANVLLAAVVAITAGCGAGLRSRDTGAPERLGWILLAAGCWLWGAGKVAQLWLPERATDRDVASIATSAGYLAMAPLVLAGLVLLRPARGPETDSLKGLLDLVIAVATIATVSWTWFVYPVMESEHLTRLAKSIVVGHVAGDIVLLVATLVLLLWLGNRPVPRTFGILAGSLIALAVADLLWTASWSGVDAGAALVSTPARVVAFLGIGFAAFADRRQTPSPTVAPSEPDDDREPMWRTLFPYPMALLLLMLVGLQVLAGIPNEEQPVAVIGSLTVIALVILRQGLTLRDSQQMTRRLSQQVDRDPLTGLINHRKIHERLERELAHARARGHAVSIALIDVDDFKSVNDRYGHPTGDQVLRVLASLLVRTCRDTDVAARYAGDEFLLIFPGLDLPDARKVGQRLLSEIARHHDRLAPGPDDAVSLSIGLAVSRSCVQPARHLIAVADAAMYDAKAAGKNRVVIVDADTFLTEADGRSAEHQGGLFPHIERALLPN
jgi:diguanylate cyclase (GGDEF)-like protein